jgi:hypothetical protein
MPQRSKRDMATPEEALEEGLRVLKPGQCWKTPACDMVVAEVIPGTKTVVLWVHNVAGRFVKQKIRIARFMLDYDPVLKR